MSNDVALIVRRTIRAKPDRIFDALTTPADLRAWWGPRPVRCADAQVDLKVGGRYRIDNELPDGSHIIIEGEFMSIEPPTKLVYTWTVTPGTGAIERVTVRLEPRGDATEVIVIHEHIGTQREREGHEEGWIGCLEGLSSFFAHEQ